MFCFSIIVRRVFFEIGPLKIFIFKNSPTNFKIIKMILLVPLGATRAAAVNKSSTRSKSACLNTRFQNACLNTRSKSACLDARSQSACLNTRSENACLYTRSKSACSTCYTSTAPPAWRDDVAHRWHGQGHF